MPTWRYLSEIYEMQVRAIFEAVCNAKKKGVMVYPEIMLPIISTEKEFEILRASVCKIALKVMRNKNITIGFMIGTMIELPRAALIADKIANHAEFFSFGTNDLTQMTFGLAAMTRVPLCLNISKKAFWKKTHSKYWTRKALDNW